LIQPNNSPNSLDDSTSALPIFSGAAIISDLRYCRDYMIMPFNHPQCQFRVKRNRRLFYRVDCRKFPLVSTAHFNYFLRHRSIDLFSFSFERLILHHSLHVDTGPFPEKGAEQFVSPYFLRKCRIL